MFLTNGLSKLLRALTLLLCLYSSQALTATIALVDSYHESYQWSASYRQGIDSVLGVKHSLSIFELDTKRTPKHDHAAIAAATIDAITQLNPDLVILADDNAVSLLAAEIMELSYPLIVMGLNANPRKYHLNDYDDVGALLERPIFRRSIMMASELLNLTQPQRFMMLFDNSATSRIALTELSADLSPITLSNIRIDFVATNDYKQWQNHIKTSQQNGFSAVFVGLYHTLSNDGTHVPSSDAAAWADTNSPTPIFGFWDFAVTDNIALGGFVLDGYLHGVQAAKMALSRLNNGVKQRTFINDRQGSYYFNSSKLKHWKISLPETVKQQTRWTSP